MFLRKNYRKKELRTEKVLFDGVNEVDKSLFIKDTILITAIGTLTATAIVQALIKRKDSFRLIGTDINSRDTIVTSMDVDEFYVFPSAIENADGYLTYVLDFCKTHNVKYFFPVIDEEVVNCTLHRNSFEQIGVKLCIPNHSLIMICHFKNCFAEWIKDHFPEIEIRVYQDTEIEGQDNFPLFLKPIEGRASIGCMIIQNIEEYRAVKDKKRFVIQEYVEGEIITVDIIRNKQYNQIKTIQRRELLRNRNGCGIAVQIVFYQELNDICERLAEKLDLDGVINAEFFMDAAGRFKIIEINPRFSAGSIFSYLAGCDLVLNVLRIVDKKPCDFGEIAIGSHYARRYETYEL